MNPLNRFLVTNRLLIKTNPGVSADFCLDWERVVQCARAGQLKKWLRSRLTTGAGTWMIWEDEASGDCAWHFADGAAKPARLTQMSNGVLLNDGTALFPATWENLVRMKRILYLSDSFSTVFPTPEGLSAPRAISVSAPLGLVEFPSVAWILSALGTGGGISIAAAATASGLESLVAGSGSPSAAIGGQPAPGPTMDGVSHGMVLENLKTGFHQRRIPWTLDVTVRPGAPHGEENRVLAAATATASCITHDLSGMRTRAIDPTKASAWVKKNVPAKIARSVRAKLRGIEHHFSPRDVTMCLAASWPLVVAIKRMDDRVQQSREKLFKAPEGRAYVRAIKPGDGQCQSTHCGITVLLALAGESGIPISLVDVTPGGLHPGPHPDNSSLRQEIGVWTSLLESLGARARIGIGPFVTDASISAISKGGRGRCKLLVTSEPLLAMGRALFDSPVRIEKELWREWYRFSVESALASAFGGPVTTRMAARESIGESLRRAYRLADVFGSRAKARDAVDGLNPDVRQPFWIEFGHGFLSGAESGKKRALRTQFLEAETVRARFYRISEASVLAFRQHLARRLLVLAEELRIAPARKFRIAGSTLERFASNAEFVADISRV